MKTFPLSHLEPTLTISGNEFEMSAEILKVILIEKASDQNLLLVVRDENGLEIYAKPIEPRPNYPDAIQFNRFPEIAINKRIIFNSFITVSIIASTPQPFSLEVQYV